LHHPRTPWTPTGEAVRFSLSYDRTLFDRYGRFREDLRIGEDSEMQRRFGTEVAIEFAPDVRAVHPGPPTARSLLADQYLRGRRAAYSRAWLEGEDWRGLIARRALANAPLGARAGWRGATGARDRVSLAATAPLLVPGAVAYAAGALAAPLDGPRVARGARARARRRPPRRPRIVALVPFKDEMRFLPGLFENLRPHVDGVVALDDGSTDDSPEFVAGRPEVLQLLHRDHDHDLWHDGANRERLVRAAWEHDADWLLGIDADERVERDFRARAERVVARAERAGQSAFHVYLRELWDRPDRMRVDGVWGRKRKAVFFRARRDHAFDARELHGQWAPLNAHPSGAFPQADLLVYHLRMLRAEDRRARRERYERIDPDRRFQSIGYRYLTETDGLVLAPLPYGRDFTPMPEVA
jgi:GT2 family glycosyltransferase